jgi:hypothetical protein
MYIGYDNSLGWADYYLSTACPPEANLTFYAAMQRNKIREEDPPNEVTDMYCWPTHYQQRVNATVDMISLEPLEVHVLGEKQAIPSDVFNTTWLESQINQGTRGKTLRADTLPSSGTPDYQEKLAETNVSLQTGSVGVGRTEPMVGLAISMGNRPLEDFLDYDVLRQSYTDAHKLMFARAMRDILGSVAFESDQAVMGRTREFTEAVVLEPVFVYIVEGLLGAVSLIAIVILYLTVKRTKYLRSDPGTMAAVVALVAENQSLLSDFQNFDCCSTEDMNQSISHKRYKLCSNGSTAG